MSLEVKLGIVEILKDTGVSDVIKNFLNLIVGDKLSIKRIKNLEKILIEAKIKDPIALRVLSDKFNVNFFLQASLEDQDYMQNLYSNLLSNTIEDTKLNLSLSFLSILKDLDTVSAKILHKIASTEIDKMPNLKPDDFYEFGCTNLDIMQIFDNLARLGLIKIIDSITINGKKPSYPKAMQLIKDSNTYYLKSDLGQNFYKYVSKK